MQLLAYRNPLYWELLPAVALFFDNDGPGGQPRLIGISLSWLCLTLDVGMLP